MKKADIKALANNPTKMLKNMSEDEIASVIQLSNYHYYNSDKPLFTDNVYDIIKEHLQSINPYHPILKHVGAVVEDDERKVKLPYWMGSMDKIKSDSDNVNKWKKSYSGSVLISDKLDGNSGLIYYNNGEVKLFTRGNGEEGQNISHLIPFISNIPDFNDVRFKKINELTVRGELVMSKKDYEKVKDLGANGRNMVAGLLNSKIPNLEVAKLTQFVAYELIVPRHEPHDQMELLKSHGFKVVPHLSLEIEKLDIVKLSEILTQKRQVSEFEIDGIVITHNAIHNRKNGENPKYAFAFKSVAMMDRAEVVVKDVEWNISKDRYMKPVIIFDGVQLSGALVRRATGFNGKFINDNLIGPGSKILVMRSGDVIPHVVDILEKANEAAMPTHVKWVWNSTGIDIVADIDNSKNEVQIKNLDFFFSTIKVTGLSNGLLTKFNAVGLNTVGKIINVTKKQLLEIDGIKDKMADKLFDNISTTFKQINPIMLMKASNAFGRGVGEKKISIVVSKYPNILTDISFVPNISDLVSIDGIEKKTAGQFVAGLQNYWKFAKDNDLLRFHTRSIQDNREHDGLDEKHILKGVSFIFTGVRSKEAEAFIISQGGVIKSSISKNVNILICKDSTANSLKLKEARSLGIEILTLSDFLKTYKIT